ncbi:ATP-dependent RNA helicase DBP2 [Cucumispora dikerogammari]|nr:ATP-dependent RNA helicase DBP2 [Cucumispora dikerogammari]
MSTYWNENLNKNKNNEHTTITNESNEGNKSNKRKESNECHWGQDSDNLTSNINTSNNNTFHPPTQAVINNDTSNIGSWRKTNTYDSNTSNYNNTGSWRKTNTYDSNTSNNYNYNSNYSKPSWRSNNNPSTGNNDYNNTSYGNKSYNNTSYRNNDYKNTQITQGNLYNANSKLLKNFEKNFYAKYITPSTHSRQTITNFYNENKINLKNSTINPILNFNEINFPTSIQNHFKTMNYTIPTPIQSQGWPMALTGNDLVGIAQTGSGKSLSFILPALIHLDENHKLNISSIALILAPTRELCLQITNVAMHFADKFNIKTVSIFGGVPKFSQIKQLQNNATFICACPGRLNDLIETGYVPINNVSFLVLDEADRMLDMGFEPQIKQIVNKLPIERQTLMFSATWPKQIQNLANTYMTNYSTVTIGDIDLCAAKSIKQQVIILKNHEKFNKLIELLKIDNNQIQKTIIFCNMKRSCDDLESKLKYTKLNNVFAAAIHGDKTQQARDSVISSFKNDHYNILIATDVAARGLDVRDVKRVINYDMPQDCEAYVHRIGRTGRGNDVGVSITFFTDNDVNNAKELVQLLKRNNQIVSSELIDMCGYSSNNNNRYNNYNTQKRRRWG